MVEFAGISPEREGGSLNFLFYIILYNVGILYWKQVYNLYNNVSPNKAKYWYPFNLEGNGFID